MARDRHHNDPDSPVRTYRVHPTPERVVHHPGMAHLAQQAIYAALSGQMTVDALAAWCEEADGRWPLIGWAEAGEALQRRPRPGPRAVAPGNARPAVVPWDRVSPQQRSREELERQKAVLRGMDGQAVSDEVPF